jgi:DNA mismatch repair protein MutL
MAGTRIHVLPDDLVNQIAAGEVVENAASVVKELLENALDAGATRVAVEVMKGGLERIRVTDDGCGMTAEEAGLALLRHATSKVATADDLVAIRTLGFRGEALPSIASVSRLALVTRTRDTDAGVRVTASGGVIAAEPVACPPGASVTVDDLFRDVPARLKFQKAERSQVAAIDDTVARAALARPDVHFTLSSGTRRLADHPPCRRLADRVVQVFGDAACGALSEVSGTGDGIAVTGVVGDPGRARQDPTRVVLLVNGRPVSDLSIRRAVVQAYGPLLQPGAYAVAVLRLDVDPADVDVNVHPRKSEVRFRRHRDVAGAVFAAVREAVSRAPWIATAIPQVTTGGVPATDTTLPPPMDVSPGPREPPPDAPPAARSQPGLFDAPATAAAPRFADLRYAGQVGQTVLVLEGPGTVVFVDQHAAHERVNYERLWTALSRGGVASETLLFPEVVRLEPREAGRLDAARETLSRLGFDVEPYSGDSAAVRAVPSVLRGRSVAPVVRECLATSSDEAESTGDAFLRKVVATVACHASVRAGDPLTEPEVRALLASMDGIDLAAYCPHGRQAVVAYPLATVLRWFGR